MKIYLVLHGKALPRQVDVNRPLSETGRADVARVAGFLKPLGVQVQAIWHSDRIRSLETAQSLAAVVKMSQGTIERDDIAPDDRIRPIIKETERSEEDLMIVGHLPFLSKLAAKLLIGHKEPDLLSLQRGGVACLECGLEDVWRLAWMVNPDQIADLACAAPQAAVAPPTPPIA